MQTHSRHERVDLKEAKCFLCDEPAGSAGLHNASTYDIDMKVRKCAMELEDTALLAKLAPGDMIASTLCCIVHMQSTNLKLVLMCCLWINGVKHKHSSVQFDYWLKTLSLEITLLLFVRSIREGNFQLYLESLTKIVPWMFALDHTHYSRWLPVHIWDMMLLSQKHPEILAEFRAGKFVVHKTGNNFSAIAIDQCHEQNNAVIKESGGAIGLMTDPRTLRLWMVAGPEVARMVTEFETLQAHGQSTEHRHHKQHPGVQTAFLKDVKSLVAVIEEMGNSFLEKSEHLMVRKQNRNEKEGTEQQQTYQFTTR